MLKRREYAELKTSRIIDDMQNATGMSVEELQCADQLAAKTAIAYLKELGLKYPEPADAYKILCIESGISSRAYRCRRDIPGRGIQQAAFVLLTVFTSVAIESDQRLWFHASVTRNDRKMPTYEDLTWVKANFFADTWAVQYFPTADQHISHHDKCLHLWTCLQDFKMPDFRKLGTI